MAYKRIYYKGHPDNLEICQYQVATVADISTLPNTQTSPDKCAAGSICIVEGAVQDKWSVYVLSVDGVTWKLLA